MSSEVVFHKKIKVQALDPETKHWVVATILDSNKESSKVTWAGYSKVYDCWLPNHNIRLPIERRPMRSRNAILAKNFPQRKNPKHLEENDVVYDTKKQCSAIVQTNDQYKASITTTTGETILYEDLKELEKEDEKSVTRGYEKEPEAEEIEEYITPGSDTEQEPAAENFQTEPNEHAPLFAIKTVFKTPNYVDSEPSPQQPVEFIYEEVQRTNDENIVNDDLCSMINILMKEIKEMKNDISEIKQIAKQTNSDIHTISERLEVVDTTTKALEKHIKKRKEKTKNTIQFNEASQHLPATEATPPCNLYTLDPTTPASFPANSSSEETFASLLSSSISLINESDAQTNENPQFQTIEAIHSESTDTNNTVQNQLTYAIISTPMHPEKKRKTSQSRKVNQCSAFIKSQLILHYPKEELAFKRIQGYTHTTKNGVQVTDTLSPGRLQMIKTQAKRHYKDEYKTMGNFNEIVNSKCRQVKRELLRDRNLKI